MLKNGTGIDKFDADIDPDPGPDIRSFAPLCRIGKAMASSRGRLRVPSFRMSNLVIV
jgi:hypothetical protein